MKKLKIIFIILLLCTNIFAADKEADSVLQFLKISPSPEAEALGNAYISVSRNASCLYYNPASCSFLYQKPSIPSTSSTPSDNPDKSSLYYELQYPFLLNINAALCYAKFYESLNYGALFSAFTLRKIGTIGIGVISLFYDDITSVEVDEHGDYALSEKISAGDYCFILNYGYKIFKRIGVGINLKGIIEKLADKTAYTFAADIGALYKAEKWGAGLVVENIGTPLKFEEEEHKLPLNFKIGGHYDLGIKKLLITPQDKILITGKIEKGLETEFVTGAGIEYGWKEMAFLRVGYQLFGNEDGIKAGCGIKYKNFQIDYAFNPHENLGIVHRIGIVVNIENKMKVLSEEEELFRETERGLETSLRNDILFDYNKAYIKSGAYKVLDRRLKILKKYKKYKIMIEGYTDNIGGDEFNLNLSEKRALAICEYFVNKGIDKEQLICVGLGKKYPIASNKTEEGRAKNRRVDIILLQKGKTPYIPHLIEELTEKEREKTRDLFFLGLDKYYREDPKGAIKLWKKIKTSNKELNKEIDKQIDKVEDEINK